MIHLESTSADQPTFWRAVIDDHTVVSTSGALGEVGQTERRHFETVSQAIEAVSSAADAKRAEGYADATPAFFTDLAASESTNWLIDEVSLRILNGDILDPDDATELLVEGLEQVADDLPPSTAREMGADADLFALTLTHTIWRACFNWSNEWAEDTTDVDRLLAAFAQLQNDEIECGLFTDWASLEDLGDSRGGALVWENAWADLAPDAPADLIISITGVEDSAATVSGEVAKALAAQGLSPLSVTDDAVTVRVLWRWHVSGWLSGADD